MNDDRPLILVVEDEAGVATLQRRRLERAGFRVAVAMDVDAAMTALGQGGVALVLMDYRLGTTTGLDLHSRMRAAGFELPVIMVSAAMDDAMVIEAMRAGIRDVIVKNTEYLEALPETVRGVLRQTAAVRDRSADDVQGACVLVVDDDQAAATLQARQLERAGYRVKVATSADEALTATRTSPVTLAILDLRLDGSRSGLDVYEQMKAEGRNIPAILVTAFPDQAVAVTALRAGIRDFVPKTADYLEYLPKAVERIAGQIRVERKLVDSELRLASIVGTAMDAIVMCEEDLRIVLFNRSAEEMFGCPASRALQLRLDTFIPGLALNVASQDAAGDTPGSVRQRFEVDGVRTTGERVPIELSVSDVSMHGKRLFTVIARDVSERRRIEAELRDADRRKDEFLGMLAHELRNPLAAIMNAGEVLHRMLQDQSAQKLTAVVRRQTRALARMVDDLLDVSRVTLGKIQLAKEPMLLGELIARTRDSMADALARAELHFDVRSDPEPVWLHGDPTRLEQVLANLLNNAIKFTPSGGRVTLEGTREAGAAVIRVRDTGIGMEPALLPKVFELFVQGDTSLDRSKSGLGIGLALVRQVITLHGGQVTAFSAGRGAGSEFTVRLPVLPDETVAAQDRPQPPSAVERRMRILVVDDQPDVADSVAMLVETMGHDARAVYDGAAALDLGRSERPDVIFVDIGMPGMTGYELARRVRLDPVLSHVQLVALTGYGREEDRARVREAGFDQHLMKPVGDAALGALLASLARP
jgi:PAS domain S-box-containing protein